MVLLKKTKDCATRAPLKNLSGRVSISSFTYDTRRVTLVNRIVFIKNAIINNIIHDIINLRDTEDICIILVIYKRIDGLNHYLNI